VKRGRELEGRGNIWPQDEEAKGDDMTATASPPKPKDDKKKKPADKKKDVQAQLHLIGEPKPSKAVKLARSMAKLSNEIANKKAEHDELGNVLAAQLKRDKQKMVVVEDEHGANHEYHLRDLGEKLKHTLLRGKAEQN